MTKSKLPGVKHHAVKQVPHFESGGRVSGPKVLPNPQALGRAAKARREQSSANEQLQKEYANKADALRMTNYQSVDNPTKPAGYGNLARSSKPGSYSTSSGQPAKAKDGAAALREAAYGAGKPMSSAEAKIRADRKQSKEGRR